jgi:DNA-binding GntR family transcriptional regulator
VRPLGAQPVPGIFASIAPSRLLGFLDMTISTSGRAKAAIGEMHRILDAIRKRDADGIYRASADHVCKVAELAYRGQ